MFETQASEVISPMNLKKLMFASAILSLCFSMNSVLAQSSNSQGRGQENRSDVANERQLERAERAAERGAEQQEAARERLLDKSAR